MEEHAIPGGQGVQSADPDVEYVPVLHALIVFVYVFGQAFPAEQVVQDVLIPTEYVPSRQAVFWEPSVNGHLCPAGHGVQLDAPPVE